VDKHLLRCHIHYVFLVLRGSNKLNVFIVRVYLPMSTSCKESELKLSNSNWLVDSASKRNEHQEYLLVGKGGRSVGLTNVPPSWADFIEILEPQHPGTLRDYPGLYGADLKAVPLQAWSGPEVSRKLRIPDFMTTAQDGGKVPYHNNGDIVEILIVKYVHKIYGHILKRIPIHARSSPLVSHSKCSYVNLIFVWPCI